ncbi:hypothetical protein ACR78N_21850 [Sphingobacterium siyangense]
MNLKDIFKSLKKWDNLIHDNAKDFKKLKDLLLDVDYFKSLLSDKNCDR